MKPGTFLRITQRLDTPTLSLPREGREHPPDRAATAANPGMPLPAGAGRGELANLPNIYVKLDKINT